MATHMYHISGMHCGGCVSNVKNALKEIPEVQGVQVQLEAPQAIISMKDDLSVNELQQKLSAAGNYTISEIEDAPTRPSEKSGLDKVLGFFHHKKDCCK